MSESGLMDTFVFLVVNTIPPLYMHVCKSACKRLYPFWPGSGSGLSRVCLDEAQCDREIYEYFSIST